VSLIEAIDVWFTYPGGVQALRGVSIEVRRGEVLAVVGPNGSGKSTLLLILAGLLKPEKGLVLFEGRRIEEVRELRRRMGVVFQNPDDQLFNPTVYDEIAFTLRQLGLRGVELDERVREVAERFGLAHLLNRPPYRLSYGEKRLLAIASAIAHNPDVLLLDEPTANLSSGWVNRVRHLVEELRSGGGTAVVASHDITFVMEVADKICVLVDGVLKYNARINEVDLGEVISAADLYPSAEDLRRSCDELDRGRFFKRGV